MPKIIVDGKEMEIDSEVKRQPPKREYEAVKADFFDVEKQVMDAKETWQDRKDNGEGVGEWSEEVEAALRIQIVDIINQTIEEQCERTELFRDYTKAHCQKYIDKYENLFLAQSLIVKELEEKMEKGREVGEAETVPQEWIVETGKMLKYKTYVDDFISLKDNAKR